jgi:hypothetical protein
MKKTIINICKALAIWVGGLALLMAINANVLMVAYAFSVPFLLLAYFFYSNESNGLKVLGKILFGVGAVVFFLFYIVIGGASNPTSTPTTAPAQVGKRWEAHSGFNKFGEHYSYVALNGKHTFLTKWNDQNLEIAQKDLIDCGDYTDLKIKIDDKPVREVRANILVGCKSVAIGDKKLIADITNAKTLVIQVNPHGQYAGKVEAITVAQ